MIWVLHQGILELDQHALIIAQATDTAPIRIPANAILELTAQSIFLFFLVELHVPMRMLVSLVGTTIEYLNLEAFITSSSISSRLQHQEIVMNMSSRTPFQLVVLIGIVTLQPIRMYQLSSIMLMLAHGTLESMVSLDTSALTQSLLQLLLCALTSAVAMVAV